MDKFILSLNYKIMYSEHELVLAFHYAMINNINTSYRLICIDWESNEWLKLRIYVDKPETEIDRDLMSCILTDLSYDINFKRYEKEVVFSDKPIYELDRLKCVLFMRHE